MQHASFLTSGGHHGELEKQVHKRASPGVLMSTVRHGHPPEISVLGTPNHSHGSPEAQRRGEFVESEEQDVCQQ
jgi:hypothetical protein